MARWDKAASSPIPDWFWESIENEAESHSIEVEECDVFYRCWGDASKPAILLLHGMYAHSHWWDFIAPNLTDEYYVVALDLTGMGDSDYRYDYSGATYVKEVLAVADAAGLSNATSLVAHSFGGLIAVKTLVHAPERFRALILVDSGIRHPDDPPPELPPPNTQAAIYPSKELAQARFRLQPPQPCDNDYLITYIAKNSLRPEDGGWTWKFDEDLPGSLSDVERKPEDFDQLAHNPGLKVGLIYGEDSKLFSAKTVGYVQQLLSARAEGGSVNIPAVSIPNAQHHVFLDQPLLFTEALREMLAGFNPS